jgi:hypothetical protein
MDGTTEAPQPRPQRITAGARRYYAKLRVNGQLVDNSAATDLKEDFTVDLKDVFRWAPQAFVDAGFASQPHLTCLPGSFCACGPVGAMRAP